MTQIVPVHALQSLNAAESHDSPTLLMEIIDPTLGTQTLRFASRPLKRISIRPLLYGVISNDQVYTYAISGSIPADEENKPLNTTIVLDNVTQEYTDQLIALSYLNEASLFVVLASDPDTLIRSIPLLTITEVVNSTDTMTLTLSRNPKLLGDTNSLEPWPSGLQTMQNAPGLHRQ